MTLPTEKDRKLKKQLISEVKSCHDPYSLLADALVDNQRLREALSRCDHCN